MDDGRKSLKKIDLQESCVYGPIASRRLGASLGINPVLPGKKACSFNCVYCQYEPVRPVESLDDVDPGLFCTPETLRRELGETLHLLGESGRRIDYITFAGNGEPTLHPRFPELVRIVAELRDTVSPRPRTAILTNGTTLVKDEVFRAVNLLDRAIVKLDAATERRLRQVNRPYRGFELGPVLERMARLRNLVVQTLFFCGRFTNATDADVRAWIGVLRRLEPEEVQVYSLDRTPAVRDIEPLPAEELRRIAGRLEQETGVRAVVF
jgi:wyosine [tRNA(Phe)-imidazoG37] synthetase (radical SAM superfamily)